MPNAYGLTVRYAMKANPNRSLLKTISGAGLHLDASSLNEVIRAHLAGIPYDHIMLTTQEVYEGAEMRKLEELLLQGLKYNICSLRQLKLIADFSRVNYVNPGIRIHPGTGAGECATSDSGDDYSCFGVHLSDVKEAHDIAYRSWIDFRHVHVHIGSGAEADIWRRNIDRELSIIQRDFPEAESICLGGGFNEARMPGESAADIMELGNFAKAQILAFKKKTGRKIKMEIEPGAYIVANSGYAVTRVVDKKHTARADFIIMNGGMEISPRPLFYGSRHPIYIVSGDGSKVVSSEFREITGDYKAVAAGVCCDRGDCQTLDMDRNAVPREMVEPEIGDYAVIGGAGAYCSPMAPFNYNSHTQIPEVLYTADGDLKLIRKRQTLEHMLENEI